jgi:class 3 adenylate cyclase/predicted ATPase
MMDLYAVLDQVVALLQKHGRLTYRAIKYQFQLDEEGIEVLKEELIEARGVAVDRDSKMLVRAGPASTASAPSKALASEPPSLSSHQSLTPASYTPPHLAERIRAEQAALEARGTLDGERKTITALFADLKGSTALIEGLDPEEARAIIDPALQLMMGAVHSYEGYVAQALGDGIFALFGAPIAHEDHPQRALYAALRMQDEMRRYGDQIRLKHGVPLAMRIGINTGEVVVRSIRKDDLHTDYVPVGHSTNLAARMEQMATPGSILVTAYTHKLTEGYFAFKALGQTQIRGVEEPLQVYEVLGAGPLRTRLQVLATRGLTRFVGRQSELEQMRRALEQAKAGHGQIVGVMGEPGLGKSRLFYEFKLLSQLGSLVLEAYSVSHGKASPYLPVIEVLKSYFDITVEDDQRKRREKIAGKVLMLDRSLEDTLPYLFALLGVEEQPSPLQQIDAQIRRRRTFEALKKLFLRESLNQPLIVIFEDLHWIDSETQGLLDTLSASVANAKVLLLVNYRPEYRHDWGTKTYYTQLRLAPFSKEETEEFLTFLLGKDVSLTALKPLILERTDGTPFFMEEVVQTLVEEGRLTGNRGSHRLEKRPTALHISPTVQGVLAARIDRLAPDEKALLQQLAVIGREFPLGLLQHVVSQPQEALSRLLSVLQDKEFLYEQPAFPEVEYLFKHALTQEVAYNSVLLERRRVLHERTAQAIEALYRLRLDDHYSDLAYHYSRSGNPRKAVEYLQLAGQQAVQRSANAEAVTHLTTALELLKTLPDTAERNRQELTVHVTLGGTLMADRGYAAPEVESVYAQARALCQRVGETPQLFPILRGLFGFYLNRGHLQTARELAEQLLSLAQQEQDPAFLLEAHYTRGMTSFLCGEFGAVRQDTAHCLTLYTAQPSRPLTLRSSEHPVTSSLSFMALTLWSLGYPDQARKKSREMLSLAQELSHPFSLAWALVSAAWLQAYCRERQSTLMQAEAGMTLSAEQGFPYWLTVGTVFRGWALTEAGLEAEGIAQICEGITAYRTTGGELLSGFLLGLLAEAYGKTGQIEEGLSVVAEALAVVHNTGARFYEAELYRLKGQLLLQSKAHKLGKKAEEQGEECFHRAIEIARQQQAKSLELRATTSLARLWQQQGKQREAHQLLSEICGWFTEGFDTKDLQEAKALLDELAEAR